MLFILVYTVNVYPVSRICQPTLWYVLCIFFRVWGVKWFKSGLLTCRCYDFPKYLSLSFVHVSLCNRNPEIRDASINGDLNGLWSCALCREVTLSSLPMSKSESNTCPLSLELVCIVGTLLSFIYLDQLGNRSLTKRPYSDNFAGYLIRTFRTSTISVYTI